MGILNVIEFVTSILSSCCIGILNVIEFIISIFILFK